MISYKALLDSYEKDEISEDKRIYSIIMAIELIEAMLINIASALPSAKNYPSKNKC